MFWIAVLFGFSALFFIQFGAMSVTVKLLSYALAAIVLMASVLGIMFLIRRFWPIWRGRRWRLSWRQSGGGRNRKTVKGLALRDPNRSGVTFELDWRT